MSHNESKKSEIIKGKVRKLINLIINFSFVDIAITKIDISKNGNHIVLDNCFEVNPMLWRKKPIPTFNPVI